MRRAGDEGWSDSDFVRLLAQAVEGFDRCDAEKERDRFLAEPRLTGSDRFRGRVRRISTPERGQKAHGARSQRDHDVTVRR